MRIKPTTITISHFAPEPILNILWSGMARLNSGGICKSSITLPVIPIAILQICLDASNRNENTNVLQNMCFGSSLSKPAPDIITFKDWNTIFAIKSPQPSARIIFVISFMTGAVFSKYDISILITPTNSFAAYSIMLTTISYIHSIKPFIIGSSNGIPPFLSYFY